MVGKYFPWNMLLSVVRVLSNGRDEITVLLQATEDASIVREVPAGPSLRDFSANRSSRASTDPFLSYLNLAIFCDVAGFKYLRMDRIFCRSTHGAVPSELQARQYRILMQLSRMCMQLSNTAMPFA